MPLMKLRINKVLARQWRINGVLVLYILISRYRINHCKYMSQCQVLLVDIELNISHICRAVSERVNSSWDVNNEL